MLMMANRDSPARYKRPANKDREALGRARNISTQVYHHPITNQALQDRLHAPPPFGSPRSWGSLSRRWGGRLWEPRKTHWLNPQLGKTSVNQRHEKNIEGTVVLGLQRPRASCPSNQEPTCSGEWRARPHSSQIAAGQTATWRMGEYGCLSENPGVRWAQREGQKEDPLLNASCELGVGSGTHT